MKLSIITINYNNASGLRKTLVSVQSQIKLQDGDIEHIVVDGASADGSADVISAYADSAEYPVLWLSEKDGGIYNAMNKGIEIALGRRKAMYNNSVADRSESSGDKHIGMDQGGYIQILNSGDMLASQDVTSRMLAALAENNYPALLYGNMTKVTAAGRVIGKSREVPDTLLQYFVSTMNHDCCYIRRELFNDAHYGLYDETLKIVSDWKWFVHAIALGDVRPVYVDIDVSIFDAGGISETNLALRNRERRQVLELLLPPAVLADYDRHAFHMEQMERLKRHHMYGLVFFIERVLFKLEKWGII